MPTQLRNGRGTNQYRTRGTAGPRPLLPVGMLLAQAASPSDLHARCDQVWGGRCREIVGPPTFSHGAHPGKTQRTADSAPAAVVGALGNPSNPIWAISAALRSPQCPPQTIELIAAAPHLERDQHIQHLIALHPACPPHTLSQLATRGGKPAAWVLANPSYDTREISPGRQQLDDQQLYALALNPNLSQDQQAELAAGNWCALGVATRPWPLASPVQQAVASSQDPAARSTLASRPDLDPQVAPLLATQPDPGDETRLRLAANPVCPPEVLPGLVGISNDIDIAVAGNPVCPAEVLDRMAEHPDQLVRAQVLMAANRSSQALEQLIRDEDETIKQEAVALWAAANPTLAMMRRFALDLY
jgi:hypothetical protein